MKKLFTLRSIFSLLLLIVATGALCAGLRISILEVREAAFFPVAAFAITLSYVLGYTAWSARRAWTIVLITGFILAFLESARLIEPIQMSIRSIPQFQLELIRWVLQKEPPDLSIIQTHISLISSLTTEFTSRLLNGVVEHPLSREFLWDFPILLLATWAGWQSSKHNQILLALAPSLTFHAFILNYTGQDTFSLLMAVFALILLIGINQKWNISQEKTDNIERATRETYSVIIVISVALVIIAGVTPSISFGKATPKFTSKDGLAEVLGLEKEIAQIFITSGLPRQHLIGLSPRLSETVIFTVQTGELAPSESEVFLEEAPRHYWRWLTYDIYNGQGWSTSPVRTNSYEANELALSTSNQKYNITHQHVEKSFTQDTRLYWTGSLADSTQPFEASWRITPESLDTGIDPFVGADMLGAVTKQQIYQADSVTPIVSANQLRTSSQVYPEEILRRDLNLPDSAPSRVLDLAQEITADLDNPYDKAKAIETYLREYPYSLDVPPPPKNQDVADYFLFDLRTGYCDYYATSMIVLARSMGLPARLVVGYANGIYDPVKAEYVVREADAHSWVEVYFTGTGWVEFEPTASQLPITLPDDLLGEGISSLVPFPPINVGTGANTRQLFFVSQRPILFIISLVSILLISSLWILNTQGLLKSHKTVSSIYKYIFYHGKKIYKDAPINETPSNFADKLRKQLRSGYPFLIPAPDEIKLLTDLYLKEAYTSHPITKSEQKTAIKIWGKLFWRLLYARFVRL